jgi:N-acetyl-gamma-glutamyl-phosphate reductase
MHMTRAGLVGVTGYTGMELARLLAGHDGLTLTRATSRSEAGKTLAELFPSLIKTRLGELVVSQPDPADMAEACDVVFLAVPHCAAQELAAALLAAGTKVVDLSADFRLNDPAVYETWYGHTHCHPARLSETVYGLPELYRSDIASAALVANPGCYPTASILALKPALSAGFIEPGGIVIDAKSGTTGAGRKASVATLYCEVADTFRAYNIGGKHRHTPEIEQELAKVAGQDMLVSFNPHLVPMNRGILATVYAQLSKDISQADIQAAYEKAYADEPWVRVLPAGTLPQTRNVRGSMYCDIGVVKDERANRLIVVSAIDNLARGASAQALVNANLMLGLDEAMGIPAAPLAP